MKSSPVYNDTVIRLEHASVIVAYNYLKAGFFLIYEFLYLFLMFAEGRPGCCNKKITLGMSIEIYGFSKKNILFMFVPVEQLALYF